MNYRYNHFQKKIVREIRGRNREVGNKFSLFSVVADLISSGITESGGKVEFSWLLKVRALLTLRRVNPTFELNYFGTANGVVAEAMVILVLSLL
jgi:hypothetical protein